MKALLIAEKPSLMREIKAAYMENRQSIPYEIDFLAQAGHLVGLKLPSEIDKSKYEKWRLENFPIDVPYIYKISAGKERLVRDIKEAIESGEYDFVIHAGDPDQEGELLIRLVLNYVQNTLPVKRFWSNDTTHGTISRVLQNLTDDSNYDNWYKAALVRQHEDYQFGMNGTGVACLKLGDRFKIGRVKAPIVKMIVDRELAIRNFVEKSTWKRAFTYEGLEFVNEDAFEEKEVCIQALPQTDFAIVKEVKDNQKSSKAPKLYKLSTLQQDAYKKLSFSSALTLEVLQKLYEAQAVSYPRTNCEYIASGVDLAHIVSRTAPVIGEDPASLLKNISRVHNDRTYVNDTAIATEGHTGIIPTGEGNFANLGAQERALYGLIVRRFLAIFGEEKITRNVTVKCIPGGEEELGEYIYKDSSDIEIGYEKILNPKYEKKESCGIEFSKGQKLQPVVFHEKECVSKPPARYNEGSLIAALDSPEEYKDENNKKVLYAIGTQATRAGIIEECLTCGYFTKEKGTFFATPKAEKLIAEFGDMELFNPITSGKWSNMLEQIKNGEADADTIENLLQAECLKMVEEMKGRDVKKEFFGNKGGAQILGNCPKCGSEVSTGKFGSYCKGKCGMVVSKAMGKDLSDSQIRSMLAGKKTLVRGLKGSKGLYSAYLQPDGIQEFTYKKGDGTSAVGYGWKVSFAGFVGNTKS